MIIVFHLSISSHSFILHAIHRMVLFSALARAFRTPHSAGVMRSNTALFSGVFVGIFLAIIIFKTSLLSEWPRSLQGELMGTECSKTIACSAGLSCKNGNCVSPAEACYQIAMDYDHVTLDGNPISSYGHPWASPFFGSPCTNVPDDPGCVYNTFQTFRFPFTVAQNGVACINVVFDNFFSDLKLDGNTILSIIDSNPRAVNVWDSSIIISPQNDNSMNGIIQDLYIETQNTNQICINVTAGSHAFEITGSNGVSLSYWGAAIVDTCPNPPPVAASPAAATTVCGAGCSTACIPTTNVCGSGCSSICVLPSSSSSVSSSISSSDSSSIASSDFSSSSSEIRSSESSSFSASSVSESSSLSSSEISSISSSAQESLSSSISSSILSSSISSSIESSLSLSSSAISLLSSISSSVSSSEMSSSSSSVIASSSASSLTSISSSVAVSAASSSVSSSGSSLSSSLSSSRVPKPVGTIASVSSSGIEGFDPWNPWRDLPITATFSYPSSEYAATVPAPEPVAWHWPDDPFSTSSVASAEVDIPNPPETENSEIFHSAAPSVQSSVSSLNERQNSCGDGIVQAADGEECDDNNGNSGDGCSVLCLQERGFCGDGVLQYGLGEQCDAGKANGQPQADCDSHCAYVRLPSCGDGIVDPATELCDEGAENGDAGSSCRANCILPRCGDGIRDWNEQCDDGNNLDKDVCTSDCKVPVRATTITGKPSAPLPPMQATLIREVPRTIPTPARTATGPGLVIFLVTGAAAGIGLMRRRL